MRSLVKFGGIGLLLYFSVGGGESGKTRPAELELGRLGVEGDRHFAARRIDAALETYLRGLEVARRTGNEFGLVSFLNAVAGAEFASHQYASAERHYLEARTAARHAGQPEFEAVAGLNLSSLYTALWDPEAGEAELARVEAVLPAGSPHWSRLLAQRTYLAARRGDGEAARNWGRRALEAAGQRGETALTAQVLDKLGEVAFREGRLDEAEDRLTEAFRLRRLGRLPLLESSYRNLARLRMAQARLDEAVRLTDLALAERAREAATGAGWWRDYDAAVVYGAAGRSGDALEAARRAVSGAARWRAQMPRARWIQVAADVSEAESASLLARLLAENGGPQAAVEALLAVESSRATTLRAAAWKSQWRHHRDAADALGHFLRERSEPALPDLQARLRPGEAYLAFLSAEPFSLCWVVTPDRLLWGRLPGRSTLQNRIEEFRSALAADDAAGVDRLQRQMREWLAWAGPAVWQARSWVVSADGPWFALPWAAVEPARPVSLVPVLGFREPRPDGWAAGGVAAFGDPVYNRADPRLRAARLAWRTGVDEMPRLAGSGHEVRLVAELARRADWPAEAYIGARANPAALRESLRRQPAVLHFAAHFLSRDTAGGSVAGLPGALWSQRSRRPREMILALSPDAGGSGWLTADAVAAGFEAREAIVVLSGCASGAGDPLPGAGLQGFAQAWLAAGARSVVGTLWPVADGSGETFSGFYRALQRGVSATDALAEARRAQLAAGGWHSRPSAWAGYFAMGKE